MTALKTIVTFLDDFLAVRDFDDYCPNGLQIEGRTEVRRIISGVTACEALIRAAIEHQADALLVHHGYFWKGEDACIRGMKRTRIKALLDHDISLLAYHLPLDVHAEVGNNIQLATRLGIQVEGHLAEDTRDTLVWHGQLEEEMSAHDFARHVSRLLGREPLHVAGNDRPVKTIAWCTGAAQGYIEVAADHGMDAYLSGEISEPVFHVARERGLHYFAAGHHATERYGVQALGARLAAQFGLEHIYVDIDNPV